MIKFNKGAAPKIGASKGDKPPPGRYVFEFQVSKSQTSVNKKAKSEGNLQVIAEYTVVRVLAGGEPWKNWDGNILTAVPGSRRSHVINMTRDNAVGQLNEMSLYLHGINAKDPSALRDLGVVAASAVPAEIERASEEMDKVCNNVVDTTQNPLLGMRVECEVKDVVTGEGAQARTFLAYNYSLCTQAEDIEHNQKVLTA